MRRWIPNILRGLGGVFLTLGLTLCIAAYQAHPRPQPAPAAAIPAILSLGGDAQTFTDADHVSPLDRYVLQGEAAWLPLLEQLSDPEFLEHDKIKCIPLLAGMPEDDSCPVEYSYLLNSQEVGRVLGVQALVLSGTDSACRAYVECRLPGLVSAQLAVPPNALARHPASLRVVEKVRHATRRPGVESEERELAELTTLLTTPGNSDPMPAEAERLNELLRQRQRQLLEVLKRRKQRRR